MFLYQIIIFQAWNYYFAIFGAYYSFLYVDTSNETKKNTKDSSEQPLDQFMDNLEQQDESHLLEKLHQSIAQTVQLVRADHFILLFVGFFKLFN